MSIELSSVSAVYTDEKRKKVAALNNVSLQIREGECVGIMGRTGSGKSTLIQMIAGLLTPSSGSVRIDGADIADPRYDRRVLRNAVGIVFQFPEVQLFESTVERDVGFVLRRRKMERDEKEKRIRGAMEEMGLCWDEMRDRSPLSLSGGEKRKAAIAGVLAGNPHILIFDEPFAGMDPASRQVFLESIQKRNREGATVLIVSHDADLLCSCVSRILVLEQGELCADGSPHEIFSDEDRARQWQIGSGQIRRAAGILNREGILENANLTKYDELKDALLLAVRTRSQRKDGDLR